MVGFAIATFLLMQNKRTIGRPGGAFLLASYLAYVVWLCVSNSAR